MPTAAVTLQLDYGYPTDPPRSNPIWASYDVLMPAAIQKSESALAIQIFRKQNLRTPTHALAYYNFQTNPSPFRAAQSLP